MSCLVCWMYGWVRGKIDRASDGTARPWAGDVAEAKEGTRPNVALGVERDVSWFEAQRGRNKGAFEAVRLADVSVVTIVFLLRQGARVDRLVEVGRQRFGATVDWWDPLSALRQSASLVESPECVDWDPSLPSSSDPPGCLKARQYRQVQRAIERESRDYYLSWPLTHRHVLTTLEVLLQCFLPLTAEDHTTCPERPVVLSGYWYTAEAWRNGTTGEVIWMTSIVNQVQSLGYHVLPIGPYEHWIEFAALIPEVYTIIWATDTAVVSCVSDPRCIAAEHYVPPDQSPDLSLPVPEAERGVIPLYRLGVVDYWGARPKEISNNDHWWGLTEDGDWSYHPLGQEWIATPWPLPGNHTHLPYSIEDYCRPLPVKPHAERDDSVLILAKKSSYFHRHYVSPPSFWTSLARLRTFSLLTTAEIDSTDKPLPAGLEALGQQSRTEYEALVGNVQAMVGIGAPYISPSVYTALLLQHGPAMSIGPPYVYSYYAQNYTQLEEAIEMAIHTPIERFIPETMTLSFAVQETKAYLERDWEGMFEQKVRENGGKVPALKAGLRERCIELGRCQPLLQA
ncbi:hypothetical protein P7C73_g6676, partial [Tremellales sp. Uapishka_1]